MTSNSPATAEQLIEEWPREIKAGRVRFYPKSGELLIGKARYLFSPAAQRAAVYVMVSALETAPSGRIQVRDIAAGIGLAKHRRFEMRKLFANGNHPAWKAGVFKPYGDGYWTINPAENPLKGG